PRPRQPRGSRIHHPFAREDARQDAGGDAAGLRGPPAADLGRARAAADRAARGRLARRRRAELCRLPDHGLDPVHRLGVPEQPRARRGRPPAPVDRALPRPLRRAGPPPGAVPAVRPQAARGRSAAVRAAGPGRHPQAQHRAGVDAGRDPADHRGNGESLMRVLVTRRWPAEVERALQDRFEVVLNDADRPLSQAELAAAMSEFDVLCPTVSDRIDAEVIAGGDRVRLIANYGVGFDHIDLAAAKAKGIAVSNTPGVLTDATADIAMTLLLMAARRAGEGERELRDGRWTGWRPTHLIGAAIAGKVLGLVGMGRIAIATARRAKHGFGMKIAYYGRRECDPAVAAELEAERCESLY